MTKGRHAKPAQSTTTTTRIATGATVLLGGSLVPMTLAGSASAATASEWDAAANCESTNNWSINSGNGFYGGLQFTVSTWNEYGGQEFADRADHATKEQQITVAERVLWKGYNGNSPQGKGAWPVCGVGLSNTPYAATSTPPPVTPPATDPTPPPPSAPADPPDAEDGVYTVKQGDYLAKIATALKVDGGWQKLYEINKEVIGPNPNLISPGMKLHLPGHEAPAVDPYKDGLPQVNSKTPSAKALQTELKRVGYIDVAFDLNDNYGSVTQGGVAIFHEVHGEFRSVWDQSDVQIGPKGWAHLRGEATGSFSFPASDTGGDTGGGGTPPPSSSGWVKPVNGSITQAFHNPDGRYGLGYHTGVDLGAANGSPVGSVTAGVVVDIDGAGPAYTHSVSVQHPDGVYTLYAHMSSVSVSVGQSVSAGTQLGTVGANHLHLEKRNDPTAYAEGVFSDPVAWLAGHGVIL